MRSCLTLLLGLAACSSDVLFLAPPAGSKSVIVVYAHGGVLRGHAGEVAQPVRFELPLDVSVGAPMAALFYARDLVALGLDPGALPSIAAGEIGRPIPIAELGAFSALHRTTAWRSTPQGELDLERLRIPRAALRCVERGGCFDGPRDDQTCVVPCPEQPLPEPPAPASEPALPERAPAPPAQVIMTPCRAGWTETASTTDRPAACSPPPAPVRITCAPSEMRGYGEPACRAIGSPCPAGEFAAPPPGAIVRYVRAAAADVGDGSAGDPFGSIDRAITMSPAGAVLLIGKGAHAAPARFDRALTLLGACSAETSIGPGGLALSIAGLRLADLAVTAVSVTGDVVLSSVRSGAITIAAGARARIEGSLVRGGTAGVEVYGALELSRSATEGSGTALAIIGPLGSLVADRWASTGAAENDLTVVDGASAVVDRAELIGARSTAIIATRGARATLTDVTIVDGPGAIHALLGSEIDARGIYTLGRGGCAIDAVDSGSRLTLADARIEGGPTTQPHQGCAYVGARLDLARVHVIGAVTYGINTQDARVSGTDLWIEDTWPTAGAAGTALAASPGSTMSLTRVRIERAAEAGLQVLGPASTASIADLVMRDVEGVTFDDGLALLIAGGGQVSITRFDLLRAAHGLGEVAGEGSALALSDVRAVSPNQTRGHVLAADLSAVVDVTRGAIEDARAEGIMVLNGGTMSLRDMTMAQTRAPEAGVRGVCVWAESALEAERVMLEGCQGQGVRVGPLGRARMTDLTVDGVMARSSDPAYGVVVLAGGTLELKRARIARVEGMGLRVSGDGHATLSDITVQHTRPDPARPTVSSAAVRLDGESQLSRASIEDSAFRGLGLDGNRSEAVTVEDVTIRRADRGLFITKPLARATRVRVEDTQVGVEASDGKGASITDLEVIGVSESAIRVRASAGLTIDRFRMSAIRGAAISLLAPVESPSLDLSRGLIEDAGVVLDLQIDYDPSRLFDRVMLRDVTKIVP